MQKVTIFRNIRETQAPFFRDVSVILSRIKEGASKEPVKEIRKIKGKEKRNELKRKLPAICFSGEFTKRQDISLVQHSGLICLDFDGYKTNKDMLQAKERLSKDKYVYSVFISPSGNGLKVLVKIPEDAENHVSYFNGLEEYFNDEHFDKTCKNISRVCYESYDPLIHVNENSSLFDVKAELRYKEFTRSDSPSIPITDENKIVDILVRWWERKFPMEQGQRNNNAFVLAMAFNDYGISKSLATYVLGRYESPDFKASEIQQTVNSAYSHVENHGTKYYEDEDKINDIRMSMRRGTPKKEIRHQLKEADVDGGAIDAVIARIENEDSQYIFWRKSDKGAVKMIPIELKRFLEDHGFYKFAPVENKNYVFVKVTNNLIDHTSEKEIKDFVLGYLIDQGDSSVYNYFADQTRIFREEFLTLLDTIDVFFIEDTSTEAYLYYLNCAVRVTKDSVNIIDYLDLGGYVWKDHVINRNFIECGNGTSDYQKFIRNICNGKDARVKSMESTIGYMLHAHKNLSYCPAVILNDEIISDTPEGGTGKGIFMNALSHMKKVVTINGKSFSFDSAFAYQLVSSDTQILVFDDVRKHFDFERLFSVITEGITVERKNKDAIKIPFSKSPKVAITTNYAIKGSGNSFARRKWELELFQHYSKGYTPLDEFGRLMFGDWDDTEWCYFDNYMMSCLQLYLNEGLVESVFVNLEIRKLSAATSHDFIEWCGLIDGEPNEHLQPGRVLLKNMLYQRFVNEYPDYAQRGKYAISQIKFYKWLNHYGMYQYKSKPRESRNMIGKTIEFVDDRV